MSPDSRLSDRTEWQNLKFVTYEESIDGRQGIGVS